MPRKPERDGLISRNVLVRKGQAGTERRLAEEETIAGTEPTRERQSRTGDHPAHPVSHDETEGERPRGEEQRGGKARKEHDRDRNPPKNPGSPSLRRGPLRAVSC